MENAPDIVLFWCFSLAIVLLMTVFIIAGIVLIYNGKRQSADKIQFLGKICIALSIIVAIPIVLVVGYILYIYIM